MSIMSLDLTKFYHKLKTTIDWLSILAILLFMLPSNYTCDQCDKEMQNKHVEKRLTIFHGQIKPTNSLIWIVGVQLKEEFCFKTYFNVSGA